VNNPSQPALDRMGRLNNAVAEAIAKSNCNVIEVMTVLKLIVLRVEKAFELSVMGNPVQQIADKLKKEAADGSNMEESSL